MKRNINLVKEIFLMIEQANSVGHIFDFNPQNELTQYHPIDITYHLKLLIEAGYLKGNLIIPEDSEEAVFAIIELTWAGHEFLQILKDKESISKVLSITKDGLSSLSFDMIKSLTKQLVQTKAEKLLGIKE